MYFHCVHASLQRIYWWIYGYTWLKVSLLSWPRSSTSTWMGWWRSAGLIVPTISLYWKQRPKRVLAFWVSFPILRKVSIRFSPWSAISSYAWAIVCSILLRIVLLYWRQLYLSRREDEIARIQWPPHLFACPCRQIAFPLSIHRECVIPHLCISLTTI